METIRQVLNTVPQDFIPYHDEMTFKAEDKHLVLSFPVKVDGKVEQKTVPMHRNAVGQMVDPINYGRTIKLPSPAKMTDFVMDEPEVLEDWAGMLNKLYRKTLKRDRRSLVRVVNDRAMSILSPKYRRLNSGRLVEAFVAAIRQYDAHIVTGRAFDTFFYLKALQRVIYEPLKGEVMAFGVEFRHGDHGSSKLWLRGFAERLRCTNLMMTDTCFSEVHLGAPLPDHIEFSDKTMQLDTEARASAMTDVIKSVFEPEYVNAKMARIEQASKENVDGDAILAGLVERKRITKGEAEETKKKFRSADTELLPAGDSALRLANALSLLAQEVEPERGLELEALSGQVIGLDSNEEADPKKLN